MIKLLAIILPFNQVLGKGISTHKDFRKRTETFRHHMRTCDIVSWKWPPCSAPPSQVVKILLPTSASTTDCGLRASPHTGRSLAAASNSTALFIFSSMVDINGTWSLSKAANSSLLFSARSTSSNCLNELISSLFNIICQAAPPSSTPPDVSINAMNPLAVVFAVSLAGGASERGLGLVRNHFDGGSATLGAEAKLVKVPSVQASSFCV